MSVQAVLLPVFVQVGLTFFFLFWMGHSRLTALRKGEAKIKDVSLRQPAWPERVTQIGNTFHNQLELPILFYVLVPLALMTRHADLVFVVMSWIFVVTRLVHAYIYVTTNDIRHRFGAFVAGALVLLAMWAIFAVRILAAGL